MRWSLTFAALFVLGVALQVVALPLPDDFPIDSIEARQAGILFKAAKALLKSRKGGAPAPKPVPQPKPAPPTPKAPAPVAKPPSPAPGKPPANAPAAKPKPKAEEKGKGKKDKSQPEFKAGDFKSSSETYRNAAAKSQNSVHRVENGKLVKSKPDGKVQKGLEADHIVEGQTVANAANKATKKPSPAAVKEAKGVVNSPENLSFLDKGVNLKKGQATTAAGKGRPVTPDKNVQEYMKSTKAAGEKVADQLNKVFRKHGSNANVKAEHQKVLKANKVKRDLLQELDEFDY